MITLRKDNVVKRTDSETKAARLEAAGFVRDGAKTAPEADGNVHAAQEEALSEAKEELAGAKKEIASLKQELDGTKEQLETAVTKNRKAAAKKE